MIPDHSLRALYAETVEHCREHGAFDPATMGTTPNVGLMAQAAEEYGSHDKTFEIAAPGTVRVVDEAGDDAAGARGRGRRHLAHVPDQGRADPGLGAARGRRAPARPACPAVFWLDETRAARRRSCIAQGPRGPAGARHRRPADRDHGRRPRPRAFTLERARNGEDTISVTGNVLRDYLTDLFPILELGTSAKMLSIVPLMNGGGLFETGAGGSAPKHVQQFLAENHLRWDSLGEFLALGRLARVARRQRPTTRARRSSPTRSTGRPARCSRRTARRRARSASSTTAAATSTWRSTGRRSWPARATTPSWRPLRAAGREARRRTRRRSSTSSTGCRVGRSTSAATTGPTEQGAAAMRPSETFNDALADL